MKGFLGLLPQTLLVRQRSSKSTCEVLPPPQGRSKSQLTMSMTSCPDGRLRNLETSTAHHLDCHLRNFHPRRYNQMSFGSRPAKRRHIQLYALPNKSASKNLGEYLPRFGPDSRVGGRFRTPTNLRVDQDEPFKLPTSEEPSLQHT